jgi:hypothetical protein
MIHGVVRFIIQLRIIRESNNGLIKEVIRVNL